MWCKYWIDIFFHIPSFQGKGRKPFILRVLQHHPFFIHQAFQRISCLAGSSISKIFFSDCLLIDESIVNQLCCRHIKLGLADIAPNELILQFFIVGEMWILFLMQLTNWMVMEFPGILPEDSMPQRIEFLVGPVMARTPP